MPDLIKPPAPDPAPAPSIEGLEQQAVASLAAFVKNFEPPVSATAAPVVPAPKLEDLKKLVDASSEKNRNFFMGYLALLIYVLVLTLGVSDKELLLNQREIAIPLLSLGLTPSVWFVVTPIALFIMHLDLVMNLREHMRKLLTWREVHLAQVGAINPGEMQPFFVDFAFAHAGAKLRGGLFYFMLWLTVGILSPLTLLIVLVKFGKYQSIETSGLHMLLLLGDLILVWSFTQTWRRKVLGLKKAAVVFSMLHAWMFVSGILAFGVICAVAVPFDLATAQRLLPLVPLAPRLVVANTVLVSVDATEKQALELLLQRQARSQPKLSPEFARTIAPNELPPESVADLWWEHGARLNLRGRHLNFADLSGSLLPRAVLISARLHHATLSQTQLQGALLNDAQLPMANLGAIRLRGARMSGAQLQKADLNNAQLQEVDLHLAQLQVAKLEGAQLFGAQLHSANLQGANLHGASLHTANLSGTLLQGADLTMAQMQGAQLSGVVLKGADIGSLGLQGTYCAARPSTFEARPVDWSACRANMWRIVDHSEANFIINELKKNVRSDWLLESGAVDRVRSRIGIQTTDQAVCGDFTQAMLDTVLAKSNGGAIELGTMGQWRKTAKPCPIPGDKSAVANKPAADEPPKTLTP